MTTIGTYPGRRYDQYGGGYQKKKKKKSKKKKKKKKDAGDADADVDVASSEETAAVVEEEEEEDKNADLVRTCKKMVEGTEAWLKNHEERTGEKYQSLMAGKQNEGFSNTEAGKDSSETDSTETAGKDSDDTTGTAATNVTNGKLRGRIFEIFEPQPKKITHCVALLGGLTLKKS